MYWKTIHKRELIGTKKTIHKRELTKDKTLLTAQRKFYYFFAPYDPRVFILSLFCILITSFSYPYPAFFLSFELSYLLPLYVYFGIRNQKFR